MRKTDFTVNQFYKITPTCTISYYTIDSNNQPNRTPFNKQLRKCNSQLSHKSKQNLRNCFNWLRIISNKKQVYSKQENKYFTFKLNFITLTLSDVQKHSDEFIKNHMLMPFLKWMQRSWHVNSYIWKAEVQNNGNIHFHITTNKFIHWKSIRTKWNRLLSKYNYCKVYQDGTNDKGSCATEIKAVKNEKQITNYMVNYISKKDLFKKVKDSSSKKYQYIMSESCELNNHYYVKENYRQCTCEDGTMREYKRSVHGRLWSGSSNLNESNLVINEADEDSKYMHYNLNRSNIFDKKELDFCNVYTYKTKVINQFPDGVRDKLKSQIKQMRENDIPQYKVTIESIY